MSTTTTRLPADFARNALRELLADRPREVKWCRPELLTWSNSSGALVRRIHTENESILPCEAEWECDAAAASGRVIDRIDSECSYFAPGSRHLDLADLNRRVSIITRYGFHEVRRWEDAAGVHVYMESDE